MSHEARARLQVEIFWDDDGVLWYDPYISVGGLTYAQAAKGMGVLLSGLAALAITNEQGVPIGFEEAINGLSQIVTDEAHSRVVDALVRYERR